MFERFGTMIESLITSNASNISSELIEHISPVIMVCVVLYFTIKGWLFLTGRIEGAIPDTVISTFKICLLAFFALNAGNFTTYTMEAINSFEVMLVSVVSSNRVVNAWAALDLMWLSSQDVFDKLLELFKSMGFFELAKASITDGGPLLILGILLFIGHVIISVIAFGIILFNKIGLCLALGLGPMFICSLMFPLTRSWFDGWIRSCLNMAITSAFVVLMLSISMQAYIAYLDSIKEDILNQAYYIDLVQDLLFCVVICGAIGFTFSKLSSLASGLVGGISLSFGLPDYFTAYRNTQAMVSTAKMLVGGPKAIAAEMAMRTVNSAANMNASALLTNSASLNGDIKRAARCLGYSNNLLTYKP